MIDFNIRLQTETILLRPVKESDLESFAAITNDPSMWLYFTSDLSDRNELETWVETALKQRADNSRLAFTIFDKTADRIVGSTSFGNISRRDLRIEIGWTWLGRDFQGKGINSQIKYLMLGYCFDILDFARVEFKTDVLNLPARRALTKAGMTEEGVLRSHTLMTHHRRRDTIFYGILRAEWDEVKAKNCWPSPLHNKDRTDKK